MGVYVFCERKGDQDIGADGMDQRKRKFKNESKCVMYMHQHHMINAIFTYCKHVLLKKDMKKKRTESPTCLVKNLYSSCKKLKQFTLCVTFENYSF